MVSSNNSSNAATIVFAGVHLAAHLVAAAAQDTEPVVIYRLEEECAPMQEAGAQTREVCHCCGAGYLQRCLGSASLPSA